MQKKNHKIFFDLDKMQCFEPFNMLTVNKCSDTEIFRHSSNPAFCSL